MSGNKKGSFTFGTAPFIGHTIEILLWKRYERLMNISLRLSMNVHWVIIIVRMLRVPLMIEQYNLSDLQAAFFSKYSETIRRLLEQVPLVDLNKTEKYFSGTTYLKDVFKN